MEKKVNWYPAPHHHLSATRAYHENAINDLLDWLPPWLNTSDLLLLLLTHHHSHLGVQTYNIKKITIEFEPSMFE